MCPLWVNQPGQLSLPSIRGRWIVIHANTWITGVETIKTADQAAYGWLVIGQSVGAGLALRPAVDKSSDSITCMMYLTYVADHVSHRGLRSFCSDCLVQPPVHRSTVGSRAFSVAGPQVWNCLPPEVTSAPSLTAFRTRLETFLFTLSYPDIRLIQHLCVYTQSIMDQAVFEILRPL